MKIMATSDTHGVLPNIEGECDLFIHAGDIAGHSAAYRDKDQESVFQTKWMMDTFCPWAEAINSPVKIIIPGNHDVWAYDYFNIQDRLLNYKLIKRNISCIGAGISFMVGDLKVGVWPFTRPIPEALRGFPYWWGGMSEESQYKHSTQYLEWDIDILVSHAPPFGLCDYEGNHYGSTALRRLIDEGCWPNLKYGFFAHIHNASVKEMEYRGIRMFNCAKRLVRVDIE